jgi:hypothetical protein
MKIYIDLELNIKRCRANDTKSQPKLSVIFKKERKSENKVVDNYINMGKTINEYRILVGEPFGKSLLEREMRWEDNMDRLKDQFLLNRIKNSTRVSQETYCVSIKEARWLRLFREIISLYSGNNKEDINMVSGRNADVFNAKAPATLYIVLPVTS